eukprot:UN10164
MAVNALRSPNATPNPTTPAFMQRQQQQPNNNNNNNNTNTIFGTNPQATFSFDDFIGQAASGNNTSGGKGGLLQQQIPQQAVSVNTPIAQPQQQQVQQSQPTN